MDDTTRNQLMEDMRLLSKKNKLLRDNELLENGLIDVKTAAQILSVTQIHLRKLIHEGKIPFINLAHGKINKSIRLNKRDIEALVENGGVQ